MEKQINIRVNDLHYLMIRNLKRDHKKNISEIIRNSIEFYFNYLNDSKNNKEKQNI